MFGSSGDSGQHSSSCVWGLLAGILTIVALLTLPSTLALAQVAGGPTGAFRSEFREPVTLASKDGVLEVRLTARHGEATLDTVAKPVKNFLLFNYELIRGTASNGQRTGQDMYPAPTLQVFPGETLIVHLENSLSDLTIRDYYSPQYTPNEHEVPLYPIQLTSSPVNLHVHACMSAPRGMLTM